MYSVLTLEEFGAYYDILLKHFPKKEIKEYQYLKDLFEKNIAKAITLKEDNKIIGVLSYFDLETYAFVDYFAISDAYQGRGLGASMLAYFKSYIDKPFVLEVEHPCDEQAKRRIAFYERNQLCMNPYPYVIPPVRELKIPLHFFLMSYPMAISEEQYQILYPKILKKVYQIKK